MNWLATALILSGYILVIYKSMWGFIVQSLGCIIFVWLYFGTDYAIVVVNSVFLMINLVGLYKWQSST